VYPQIKSKITNIDEILSSYYFAHEILINIFSNPIYFNDKIVPSSHRNNLNKPLLDPASQCLRVEQDNKSDKSLNYSILNAIYQIKTNCEEYLNNELKNKESPLKDNIKCLIFDLDTLFAIVRDFDELPLTDAYDSAQNFVDYNIENRQSEKTCENNLTEMLNYIKKTKNKIEVSGNTIYFAGKSYPFNMEAIESKRYISNDRKSYK